MFLPKPKDTNFLPPPSGTHVGVCYRVIDLGTQLTNFENKPKQVHQVMLSWELQDELMTEGDNAGKPFTISRKYSLSMDEKATLRKHLESWRGAKFNDNDFGEGGFNMRKLIGVGCLLGITHEEKEGKIRANISSISKLMKGYSINKPVNEIVYISLTHEDFEQYQFDKLSKNLKETIEKSPEFQELKKQPALINGDHSNDDMDIPFA